MGIVYTPQGTQNNTSAIVAPTVNDDSSAGYSIDSHWIDTVTDTAYILVDDTVGAAIWSIVNAPTAVVPVDSVNGETGVVVLDADDINDTSTTNKFVTAGDLTLISGAEQTTNKGNPNGYASLDGTGKVPASELPSYVDDVLEYADLASFPVTGETGKIYVALDTNSIYRWTGTVYVEVSADAGAPVSSVNTKTGAVVLDPDDLDDTATTNKFVTGGDVTKLGHITVTQAVNLDTIESDTATNNSKVSNVDTNLSIGTKTATTLDINSSDGTNATIPSATATEAGLMSAADKVVLDNISDTDDQNASEVPVTPAGNLTSTDVQAALQELQGDIDALPGGHDAVTLNVDTTTQETLNLSTQELQVNKATASTDGAMSAEDKTKLDAITGTNTGDQDLSGYVQTTEIDTLAELNSVVTDATLIDTTDSRLSDARTPLAHTHTASEVTDFDTEVSNNTSVAANTAKETNVDTNLSIANKTATTLDVASSDGTDATIPAATITEAGLMSAADKVALDAFVDTDDQDASEVSFTPTGNTISTNVQDAIVEIQTEIDGLAGGHDAVTLNAGATTQESANLVGQELELVKATSTTDGVMSSEDKDKLDNVAANANNYVHPNHTGEVTSIADGVQTLDVTAISNKTSISATAGMELLVNDGGVLKKVDADDFLYLATKSGNEPVVNFTGNPKTATITFATAFPDANYSIILTPEVNNANSSYVLSFLSKTASGFTISTGTNSTANLMSVDWTAIYYGES